MIAGFVPVLTYIAFLAFSLKRLLTYTHALQQEEYDNRRFFQWIIDYKVFDKRLSLALLASGCLWYFIPHFFWNVMIFISFAAVAYTETDPRKDAKKKLVMTARVKRMYIPAFALLAITGLLCLYALKPWSWILAVQAVPLALMVVNFLSQSFERSIQQKYWDEAHEKIVTLSPKVIAITGSYGKTSAKHILGHILKSYAGTLITPGSVNTPMGIARIVRENLDESHTYFVVEMGAYGPGSIQRLCALTPPDMGIITAIGHAHYERFKSLETVAKAKFELAEAVLKKNGRMIVHEKTLQYEHAHKIKNENENNFIVCGEPSEIDPQKRTESSHITDDDLQIHKVDQHREGLSVTIAWKGQIYNLDAPLFGRHHGHNIALAFAAAMALGVPAETIQTALKTLPQISHRLEVKKQSDGRIFIDDAFNSNPKGFRAALDTLAVLKRDNRAILITPGMVELGKAHEEEHKNIGLYAGRICDVVIAVCPERIPSLIEGVKTAAPDKTVIEVKTFQEASNWLEQNKQPGDVVLIENDLPDIYERIPAI